MTNEFYISPVLDEEFSSGVLEEQLNCLCHACREDKRFNEDTYGANECLSMNFDGRNSESLHARIDIMSLSL